MPYDNEVLDLICELDKEIDISHDFDTLPIGSKSDWKEVVDCPEGKAIGYFVNDCMILVLKYDRLLPHVYRAFDVKYSTETEMDKKLNEYFIKSCNMLIKLDRHIALEEVDKHGNRIIIGGEQYFNVQESLEEHIFSLMCSKPCSSILLSSIALIHKLEKQKSKLLDASYSVVVYKIKPEKFKELDDGTKTV